MLNQANTWELEPEPRTPVLSSTHGKEQLPLWNRVPNFCQELPPSRSRERIAWSAVLHLLVLVAVVKFAAWLPAPRVVRPYSASGMPIYTPRLEAPPAIVPKLPAPTHVLAKVAPPKLEAPPKPLVEPKTAPPVSIPVEPRKEVVPETSAAAPAVKPEPPKREVVVDTFASGSSAPVTVPKPEPKVQTGGFGDANGVAGTSDSKRTLTVASSGAFDLPSGAGKGNGSAGTHGAAGTVASAGFGDGVAAPGRGDQPRGPVTPAGFSNMTAAAPAARTEAKPQTTPVEILYKPKPVYTSEARQLRIQGEVLVEVMFRASGDMQVNRVTQGLGHGLDEAALHAAHLIKFRPATRDGRPYDSNAIVHIIFELAE
jgi:TonB family protein